MAGYWLDIRMGTPLTLRFAAVALLSFVATSQFAVADIQVVDDLGNDIHLTRPARRIISLAPHTTELLFAAGAGQYVVGVVGYSDYPPAAKKITLVGDYQAFDIEKILSLKPDLLVAWHSGNGASALKKLQSLELPVYITEPRTFEEIATNIQRLGELAGTTHVANQSVSLFRQQLAKLRQTYKDQKPLTVFYEIWNQPLMTINGQHIISKVIELCGGRNVFYDLGALAPTVSIEAVLKVDPQVIIASGMGESRPEWLNAWQVWDGLSAVKYQNLYSIPADLIQRHTPRLLDGAELVCKALQRARSRFFGITK